MVELVFVSRMPFSFRGHGSIRSPCFSRFFGGFFRDFRSFFRDFSRRGFLSGGFFLNFRRCRCCHEPA